MTESLPEPIDAEVGEPVAGVGHVVKEGGPDPDFSWTGNVTEVHDDGLTFSARVRTQRRPVLVPDSFFDGTEQGAVLGAWLTKQHSGTIDGQGREIRADYMVDVKNPVDIDLRDLSLLRVNEPLAWPEVNAHLRFEDPAGDNKVRRLKVRGPNVHDTVQAGGRKGYGWYDQRWEFSAAFRADRQQGSLLIEDLDVDAVWGDGYQLQVVNGVTVKRSRIRTVGRQIATLIGQNIWCDGDIGTHPRRAMYDIELDTAQQIGEGVQISNFVCGHVEQDANGNDVYLGAVNVPIASAGRGSPSRVHVHHGTIYGATTLVFCKSADGARRWDWTIEDLTAIGQPFGSPGAPITLINVTNAAVRRVKRSISKYKAGVYSQLAVQMRGCDGLVEMVDNEFPVVAWDGKTVTGDSPYYRDETPMAGRQLVMSGNVPPMVPEP